MRAITLDFCKEPRTSEEIRNYLGIETKSVLSRNIIKPLIEAKLLDYTNKNNNCT